MGLFSPWCLLRGGGVTGKADPSWRLSRDPPSFLPAQPLPQLSDGQSKGRSQVSGDFPLQHPCADVGPALHPGDLEQAEDTTRPLWLARLVPLRYRASWDVGQLERTGDVGQARSPAEEPGMLISSHPTSRGTGLRVWLCFAASYDIFPEQKLQCVRYN